MTSIQLSEDQKEVYDKILEWMDDPASVLRIGGYAGTGKTTLLAKLISENSDGYGFACAAYTGKAAQVLENKLDGVCEVTTIHRLAYNVRSGKDGEAIFTAKTRGEIQGGVNYLVIDEASMVSDVILRDLLSLRIPILAIGDHGQLPPVDGEGSLMKDPDLRLEKIHRQAAGSPIIQLSVTIREKGKIPVPPPKGIEAIGQHSLYRRLGDELPGKSPEELLDVGLLTYRNRTRAKVNEVVRQVLFPGAEGVQVGDLVICLRNNHMAGVFNGMRGIVQSVKVQRGPYDVLKVYFPDEDKTFEGQVLRAQFGRESTFNDLKSLREEAGVFVSKVSDTPDLFDFGYAMTVHKAQGSQFRQVFLYKERPYQVDEDSYKRWLYTGCTRASEKLTLVAC